MGARVKIGQFAQEEELTPEAIDEIIYQDQESKKEFGLESEAYSLLRSVDIAIGLESLREELASKTSLSQSEQQLIRVATEMAVAGTDVPAAAVIKDIPEDVKQAQDALQVSVEGALDKIAGRFKKLLHDFSAYFEERNAKSVDFQSLVKKVIEKEREFRAIAKRDSLDIAIPDSDFFYIDNDKAISSFKELVSLYEHNYGFLFNAFKHVSENGRSFKEFDDAIMHAASSEEVQAIGDKIYVSLHNLMSGLAKHPSVKAMPNMGVLEGYKVNDLLGGDSITITFPKAKKIDWSDKKTLTTSGLKFDLELFRGRPTVKKTVSFKVEKKDITRLTKLIQENNSDLNNQIGLIMKLVRTLPKDFYAIEDVHFDASIPEKSLHILYTYKLFILNFIVINRVTRRMLNFNDWLIIMSAHLLIKLMNQYDWKSPA